MPKAQKPIWPGYWEPTLRNRAFISQGDGVTSIYDRGRAFRQSQRNPFVISSREGSQQRGQKRGANFAADDEDSEGEAFHTRKVKCMTVDLEDEATMEEDGHNVAQNSAGEPEHHQEKENPASLTIPSNDQFLGGIQERLATMENRMQALDKTTEKHVGDIDNLLPRMTELTIVSQAANKRVDTLVKGFVAVNTNVSALAEEQLLCSGLNPQVLSLCEKLVGLVEQAMNDLRTTRKALDETRAAQAEDRATISSLQKELSEMKDEESTTTESTSMRSNIFCGRRQGRHSSFAGSRTLILGHEGEQTSEL